MSRKTEVIIAVFVLVLLALLLYFLWPRGTSTKTTPTQQETTTTNTEGTPETPVVLPPQHATATTVARIFVERFGSYSTESDFANVDDVLPLATTSLKKRLQSLAEEARSAVQGGYYGVSTNVIKITVEEQKDTATTLLVKTQREEAFGNPGNTSVRYEDIRVEFVKEGEDWFVNDFTWL